MQYHGNIEGFFNLRWWCIKFFWHNSDRPPT